MSFKNCDPTIAPKNGANRVPISAADTQAEFDRLMEVRIADGEPDFGALDILLGLVADALIEGDEREQAALMAGRAAQ